MNIKPSVLGMIFLDAEQEKAINKFQELYNKIIGLKGSSNSILGNIGLNLFNSSSKRLVKEYIFMEVLELEKLL